MPATRLRIRGDLQAITRTRTRPHQDAPSFTFATPTFYRNCIFFTSTPQKTLLFPVFCPLWRFGPASLTIPLLSGARRSWVIVANLGGNRGNLAASQRFSPYFVVSRLEDPQPEPRLIVSRLKTPAADGESVEPGDFAATSNASGCSVRSGRLLDEPQLSRECGSHGDVAGSPYFPVGGVDDL